MFVDLNLYINLCHILVVVLCVSANFLCAVCYSSVVSYVPFVSAVGLWNFLFVSFSWSELKDCTKR